MANSKITDLTTLTGVETNDIVAIVDVSDTTQSSSGTTKKITVANLTANNVDLTSAQTLTNKILTAPALTGATTIGTGATITTPTITKPVMNATNPSAQTYSPSSAGTATLDLSLANEHRITMPAGNITIALTNDTNAQKFIISILQDSTGSRIVTWFTTIKWAGGVAPTLTTTASKRDTFGFIRTGSGTYDGFIIGQNL